MTITLPTTYALTVADADVRDDRARADTADIDTDTDTIPMLTMIEIAEPSPA